MSCYKWSQVVFFLERGQETVDYIKSILLYFLLFFGGLFLFGFVLGLVLFFSLWKRGSILTKLFSLQDKMYMKVEILYLSN